MRNGFGEAVAPCVGMGVDLERGAVSLDKNKTNDPRSWALDPGVVRALKRYLELRNAKEGDSLLADDQGAAFDNRKLAMALRSDLEAAGVKRRELHEKGEYTAKLRTHDLRGTFVTLSLANGKTETWVADRTGHKSSTMINGYRRLARSARELGLGPLKPLDQAIPELRKLAAGGPEGGPNSEDDDPETHPNAVESHDKPKWRNRQTRRTQNPFPARE